MAGKAITLAATNGTNLFTNTWGDPLTAKAVIVLSHGLGEHCLRYGYVAEKITERGLCLVGFDHRGHGQSAGGRGAIPSNQQLLNDVTMVINYAVAQTPNVPVFLYGHSLGALIALYYAMVEEPRLQGVIATSPPLEMSVFTPQQRKLVSLLKGILPGFATNNGLNADYLSHDLKIVEAYKKDPLVHDKVSIRLAAFMIEAVQYLQTYAENWKLPLYLAHGTADQICPISGTDEFAAKLKVPFTYNRWEGLYHETHNEPEKDEVISAMLDWVEAQI